MLVHFILPCGTLEDASIFIEHINIYLVNVNPKNHPLNFSRHRKFLLLRKQMANNPFG
jgi:hypothetical protein